MSKSFKGLKEIIISMNSESTFYRLRRIYYSDSDKEETMKNRFMDWGYPSELVDEALNSYFQKMTSYSS